MANGGLQATSCAGSGSSTGTGQGHPSVYRTCRVEEVSQSGPKDSAIQDLWSSNAVAVCASPVPRRVMVLWVKTRQNLAVSAECGPPGPTLCGRRSPDKDAA